MKRFAVFSLGILLISLVFLNSHPALAQSESQVKKVVINQLKNLRNSGSKLVRILLSPSSTDASQTDPSILPRNRLPITLNCPKGGTVTYNGDFTHAPGTTSITGQADLAACAGLTGTLTLGSETSLADNTLTSSLALGGDLTGICTRNIPINMTAAIQFNGLIAAKSRTATGTVSGTVDVQCGPLSALHCSWDNVLLRDKAALKAGCTVPVTPPAP